MFDLAWDKDTVKSEFSFSGEAVALVYMKPVLDITVYKVFTVAFVFKIGYQVIFALEASIDLLSFDSVDCERSLSKFITLDVALNASANLLGAKLFSKQFNLYANKWLLDGGTNDCSLPLVSETTTSTTLATTSPAASTTITSQTAGDRAEDGCACARQWSTSSVQCTDYCCLLDGFDRHLCIKEDRDCGTDYWGYCLAPRTLDGCKCKQVWSWSGSSCSDYCCDHDEPQLWCFKEDQTCGSGNWDYCKGEESRRRLATCSELQPFCNANACANEQPDCHRCGLCDTLATSTLLSSASLLSSGAVDVAGGTSTTSSTGGAIVTGSFELGTLWRGRIWEEGASCSASEANLVLQLVELDDWGHGNGMFSFMGSTNPKSASFGSCSITMSYVVSMYGSRGTLQPQLDDADFFGECEGFALPYGWVVQITTERIRGSDTMQCMHIELTAVNGNDMFSDPSAQTTTTTSASTVASAETTAMVTTEGSSATEASAATSTSQVEDDTSTATTTAEATSDQTTAAAITEGSTTTSASTIASAETTAMVTTEGSSATEASAATSTSQVEDDTSTATTTAEASATSDQTTAAAITEGSTAAEASPIPVDAPESPLSNQIATWSSSTNQIATQS